MRKFKVGDKVKVVCKCGDNSCRKLMRDTQIIEKIFGKDYSLLNSNTGLFNEKDLVLANSAIIKERLGIK